MPAKNLYKYTPNDFGKLPLNVKHMDLDFDIYEDHTNVVSQLTATVVENTLKTFFLNAKNLEIKDVTCKEHNLAYKYDTKEHKLFITFEKPLKKNQTFTIITKTTCRPTANVLEGIYYDLTPKGAPPTQITQCQQWGFQRIVPCVDDMTAKCTYRTTITADSRYTNIITNGDVAIPRKTILPGRDKVTYDNTKTPMAPYLFFLGVGTYKTFRRALEYADGTTIDLEILAPITTEQSVGEKGIALLHDAILWIYLFTGKDKHKQLKQRHELWTLLQDLATRKLAKKDVKQLRATIKQLSQKITFGYQYTGKVYREIGMHNSDFGGMENVGNTTITANRLLPYTEITDGAFEYLLDVKAHEFYHNINGSEVTGWSPFEIWLNEAVTVHITREFLDFLIGESYNRLGDVQSLLAPGGGTLAQDEGAASMPIEPDGFNDPNELITAITYVKAPEFVRMIQTLMGKDNFAQGLALYHSQFKHSNATRADWIRAMETVSKQKFASMANTWLKKTQYPTVQVQTRYTPHKKTLTLTLEQTNKTAHSWEFPFVYAVFDAKGKKVAEHTVRITKKKQTIVIPKIQSYGFVSLNRTYSFYGKVTHDLTREQLLAQLQYDDDYINKYMAFYTLMDAEKLALLKNKQRAVSEDAIHTYYQTLTTPEHLSTVGPQIALLFESVEHPTYAYHFQELFDVRKKILKDVARAHEKELLTLYHAYCTPVQKETYTATAVANVKQRAIKNSMLGVLAHLDTKQIHALIKKQYLHADNATDRLTAFSLYLNSTATDKHALIRMEEKRAVKDPVVWESFLALIGGTNSTEVYSLIRHFEKHPSFKLEQTHHHNSLFGSFARNRKRSLQTPDGRALLKEMIIKLTSVNEYSTINLIKLLGIADKMEEEYHLPLAELLVDVMMATTAEKTPSVYNTARRILLGQPKLLKAYEKEHGKIKTLT